MINGGGCMLRVHGFFIAISAEVVSTWGVASSCKSLLQYSGEGLHWLTALSGADVSACKGFSE
jgi:hypothetical protein